MLARIARLLWGKFESTAEIKKFALLSLIFCMIIGTYWALRPMKDSIFNALIGIDWQPWAKILSLCFIVPLVIIYSKLIDLYPRSKVFYILTGFYGIAALIFMLFFMHPTIGLPNVVKDSSRILGWIWYVYVESFGSLLVALFWAFVTDITKPGAAKRGFPMIALLGQTGNIIGPFFLNTKFLGLTTSAPIVGICGFLSFGIGGLLWIFMRVTPKKELIGYKGAQTKAEKKEATGFLEGLKLLLTKWYLLGIFAVVAFYEIIITIIDFHFKTSAAAVYPVEAHYQAYLSQYAWLTGVVSTLCILFGINTIQRKLGMSASLVLLPFFIGIAVITLKLNPGTLTVALWIIVLSKAVNYALNQPTIKQLYIPTTRETKYKAQAWIDMFGSRGSKGIGAVINTFRATFKAQLGTIAGTNLFFTMTSILSLGLIGVWFMIAIGIAKIFKKAVSSKKVVC